MKYKKSYRHIGKKTINEIVAFINKYKLKYTIELMCKVLKFPKKPYYKALNRLASKLQIEAKRLKNKIGKICLESKSNMEHLKSIEY